MLYVITTMVAICHINGIMVGTSQINLKNELSLNQAKCSGNRMRTNSAAVMEQGLTSACNNPTPHTAPLRKTLTIDETQSH